MSTKGKLRLAAVGAMVVGGAASAASLAALADVEPGRWELRERGGTSGVKMICVAQPLELFHVRQPSAGCQRRVVENTARSATVTYSCPGVGKGRTAITVETGRLVQIDAQGVANGMPFATAYEARRVGDCAASASLGRRRRAS